MTNHYSLPYHPTDNVLQSSSFFWVGRGGHAILHKGNSFVRKTIQQKVEAYVNSKRRERHQIAKRLLENELCHVKFVIPRATVLEDLKKDDQKASRGEPFTRRVGLARREALMKMHNSIDQIESYPDNVCIEVGYDCTLDIVNHLLREDADATRKAMKGERVAKRGPEPTKQKGQEPAKKKKRMEPCVSMEPIELDYESERTFDCQRPNLASFHAPEAAGFAKDEGFGELLVTLFPEECATHPRRQMMEGMPDFSMSQLLEHESDIRLFDGMFDSKKAIAALLAD